MTLFRLLTEGSRVLEQSGNPDARQDAQQLLLAAFHLDMVRFLLNRMEELEENSYNQSAMAFYRDMVERRRKRFPLQQILGSQEFMGLEFLVNRHVLIPRQDTETLVELVLEEVGTERKKSLLDLCTGSGCIAVSLAAKGPFDRVTATDVSEEALKVAEKNADRLLKNRREKDEKNYPWIEFLQGDLFEALPAGESSPGESSLPEGDLFHGKHRKYDVITANPPYIPTSVIATLEPEVRDHEPRMALDGWEDGLYYYRRIIKEAGRWLSPGGALYLEIGHDQGAAVTELLKRAGYTCVRVRQDLAGHDRVASARWEEDAAANGGKRINT